MRTIIFDGRLGRDAEVAETKGGKKYVRFSVASNLYRAGSETTDWIDVTSYDPVVIEKRAQYFKQGTYVIVTGEVAFEVSAKQDKIWKNIYVTANNIDTPSLGKKSENAEGSSAETQVQSAQAKTIQTAPFNPFEAKVADAPTPSINIPTNFEDAYAKATVSASASSVDDDMPF